VNAPKPRRTGASGDSLGGGVTTKGTARRSLGLVATAGHWVVGRSGRYRLVVAYLCACGEKHLALAAGHVTVLERRAPCGLEVRLELRGKGDRR
jgi:hypothetical protein